MPGFRIKNCTPWPLTVSLDQVGPLYHGLVKPGEYFERETGAVWFTIKAVISLDNEDHVSDWDCVWPIADLVITVITTAITLGQAGVAFRAASRAATLAARAAVAAQRAEKLVTTARIALQGAKTASAKAAARVALRRAQGQAMVASREALIASTKASVKAISTGGRVIQGFKVARAVGALSAPAIAKIFEKYPDASRAGCYAGSPSQDELEEYSITGGTKYQYDMENNELTLDYGEEMKIVEGILPTPAQFVNIAPVVYGASSADANLHFNGASCVYGEKLGVVKINSIPGQFSYKTSSEKIVNAGQQTVKLTFTPKDKVNYATLTQEVGLTVLPAEPSITVNGGTFTFDENPHPGSASAVGGAGENLPVEPLIYEGMTVSGEAYGPTETPPVAAGKYVVTANTPGDDNNMSASGKATIIIKPAKAKVLAPEALKIRNGHSIHANVLDWLRHNDRVNVLNTWTDKDGKWAQIGPGQWASIYYKKKTWMEYVALERG